MFLSNSELVSFDTLILQLHFILSIGCVRLL
nr:MAG TPA: hypothetical protein [Caudoviricetes sp.]